MENGKKILQNFVNLKKFLRNFANFEENIGKLRANIAVSVGKFCVKIVRKWALVTSDAVRYPDSSGFSQILERS